MKRGLIGLLTALALLLPGAPPHAQQVGADGTPRPAPRGEGSGGRVRLPLGISITLSPSILLPSPTPAARDEIAFEPGQLLVMWPDDEAARAGLALLAQRQLQPAATANLAELGAVLALFQLPDDAAARRLREALRSEQPQWVVDLNARAWPMQRADDAASAAGTATAASAAPARLYARQMLGLDADAAEFADGGARAATRLGVIDTALDPALLGADARRLWRGAPPLVRSVLGEADTPAPSAHGSAVAMLIAGAGLANGFSGVAPAAPVAWAAAVRQVGDKSLSNSWLLAQALNWLLAQQVQLVNVSLGGAGDEILRLLVARVLARQVAVLAAAGNRADASAVYPAAYPGVWAVTAVDAAGQPYAKASRGAHVGFAAPGVDLWVPDMASVAATPVLLAGRYVSGTSFATALASALAARLPAAFWQLGAAERRQRLCAAARPALAPDAMLGCGVLRWDAALVPGAAVASGARAP